MDRKKIPEVSEKLIAEAEKIIIGKRKQIEFMVMAIFSGGHILLDDLPGSGKTTLVKTLSIALGCTFRRIQFTPDLLPSDILGMNIFNQKTGDFQFIQGPVHTNILLADEINRAIPRTQAALLEAMEERQVTIDGKSYFLPSPFFVMATQNPVEGESTFDLPAAQMDRFFVKLSLGYPSIEEEIEMLTGLGDFIPFDKIETISSPQELSQLQKEVEQIFVHENVKQYIVKLVHATREKKLIKNGASPRATKSLFKGGKAYAAIKGRDYVIPEDIQAIASVVLAHRITLSSEAKFIGKTAEEMINEIIQEIIVPPAKEEMLHV